MDRYKTDVAAYTGDAERLVAAGDAGFGAGAPCATLPSTSNAIQKLTFCSQNGQLLVQVQDADGHVVTTAAIDILVASAPFAAKGSAALRSTNGVATLNQIYLESPGSYTLTAVGTGLTSVTSSSFAVSGNLDRAKYFRNKIIERFLGDVDHVYGEYNLALYSGTGLENVTADLISLGLTAASTISLVTRTKTILAALATGFTGVSLSVNKNLFGQQTFAALAIAMQARRDTARKSIQSNEKLSISDYSLDAARRDLISYFYAGTLPGAIQEIQEEAATKSAAATGSGNAGTPAKLQIALPSTGTANLPISVQVQIEDTNGKVVTTASTPVTVSSNPPGVQGTLTVAATAGIATFSLAFPSSGSFTLTAAASGLTSSSSTTISVSTTGTGSADVGPASKLQIAAPTTGTVNAPTAFQVLIQDAAGRLVSTASNSVTISSNPPGVQGTLTVAANGGTATFNLSFPSAGPFALIAVASGLTSSTSATISISTTETGSADVGPASKLQIAAPTTGTVNAPTAFQVLIQDAAGRLVSTASNSVTISSNPSGVQGTLTAAASRGTATFSLSFPSTGPFALTASASGLTSSNNAAITIAPLNPPSPPAVVPPAPPRSTEGLH